MDGRGVPGRKRGCQSLEDRCAELTAGSVHIGEIDADPPQHRPVHFRDTDFQHDLMAATDLQEIQHLARRVGFSDGDDLCQRCRTGHRTAQGDMLLRRHDPQGLLVRKEGVEMFLEARDIRRHNDVIGGRYLAGGVP
jgi:hypothetical protein